MDYDKRRGQYARLYHANAASIYQFALYLLGGEEVARRAVEACFVKLYPGAGGFDGDAFTLAFLGELYQIAKKEEPSVYLDPEAPEGVRLMQGLSLLQRGLLVLLMMQRRSAGEARAVTGADSVTLRAAYREAIAAFKGALMEESCERSRP